MSVERARHRAKRCLRARLAHCLGEGAQLLGPAAPSISSVQRVCHRAARLFASCDAFEAIRLGVDLRGQIMQLQGDVGRRSRQPSQLFRGIAEKFYLFAHDAR